MSIILKAFIAALYILAIWWLCFDWIAKDMDVVMDPPAPVRKTERPKLAAIATPEPVAPAVVAPTPKPIEYPSTYYSKVRISRITETGVSSIPKGSRVTLMEWDDGRALIKFGKLSVVVDASEITCDAKEIAEVTK